MHPFDIIKTLKHHAYFLHSFTGAVDKLKDFLKEHLHISSEKNPDFYHQKFETFGIDESRKLKEIHLSKGFAEGGKRIFIIETSAITHEAQNALLKIFEEPNEGSHFFLIMPSSEVLLPTLRSRLLITRPMRSTDNDEIPEDKENIEKAKKFLKLSKKDKVDFVDELAKNISDEKAKKSDAIEFLTSLETVIYEKFDSIDKTAEKNRDELNKIKKFLKAILKAKDYMNDRSASVKQLLEYVALFV